jgi:hypothetical protein
MGRTTEAKGTIQLMHEVAGTPTGDLRVTILPVLYVLRFDAANTCRKSRNDDPLRLSPTLGRILTLTPNPNPSPSP